jgi:hypothetical protein
VVRAFTDTECTVSGEEQMTDAPRLLRSSVYWWQSAPWPTRQIGVTVIMFRASEAGARGALDAADVLAKKGKV